MRTREMIASLVGGVAVYVACAASPDTQKQVDKADALYVETGDETRADSPISDVLAMLDGLLPDVAVQDAKADDTGTQSIVMTGTCDKSGPANGGGTVNYAEFQFPGKTTAQLSKARGTVCLKSPGIPAAPVTYQCFVPTLLIKDGAVAVQCNPATTDSVTVALD